MVARQLHHPDGQTFRFDPGSLAFAFAVTGPPTDDDWFGFETLHQPADLERWAAEVVGASGVRATSASVSDAKRLRAAIWGAAAEIIDGHRVGAGDRGTLNAFAASPSLAPRLEPDGSRSWRPSGSASELCSTVARDTIEVISGPLSTRIKRCEGVNCALLFVDTSRPGSRRWCSMERCGNRAKATAHRRRQRQEDSI